MADNITITEGSGKTIATDDVSSVHYQKIKVALGADGAVDTILDSGQQTGANSMPVVLASDTALPTPGTAAASLGKAEDAAHTSADVGVMALGVRNDAAAARSDTNGDYTPLAVDSAGRVDITMRTTVVAVTPTISNGSAYAANDQVGGLQEIAAAVLAQKLSGTVALVSIVDKAKQNAALTILFFSASVSLVSSDNAAIDVADSQLGPYYLGHVNIAAGDYATLANGSVARKECTIPIKCGATSLYALAFTTGAPTYGSTSDLIFNYHILQD